MKIAMLGLGKMGLEIARIAQSRGHEVVTIDPHNAQADFPEVSESSLEGVGVCIDFTAPEVAVDNIKRAASLGKSVVVGTTGWLDSLEEVQQVVERNNVGFVYAANFSFGVNIFYRIAERAAELINNFDEYDVAGVEYHHSKKKDSPSGTAAHLADILLSKLERKTAAVFDSVNREIAPDELQYNSIRCGAYPGVHKVLIDSCEDTIELTHSARNRSGFASGAVRSAEWLENKVGLFTIDDIMRDIAGL